MSCGCVFLVARTVADSPFTPSGISLGSGFLWFLLLVQEVPGAVVHPGQGCVGHLSIEAEHMSHLGRADEPSRRLTLNPGLPCVWWIHEGFCSIKPSAL